MLIFKHNIKLFFRLKEDEAKEMINERSAVIVVKCPYKNNNFIGRINVYLCLKTLKNIRLLIVWF